MIGKLAAVTVAVAAVLSATAGAARAGYPVQPNGQTIAGQPTFLVYLDDGESLPMVEVATRPDMTGIVGSCYPSTPFAEPHKYTCRLYTTLSPGTYYWTYSYWKNDNCTTLFGTTWCSPQEHVGAPFQFTIGVPMAPIGAGLVTPYDGATVSTSPTFSLAAPAGSTFRVYVSDSASHLSDGSPAGAELWSCAGSADTGGSYTCSDTQNLLPYLLTPGTTYSWWALITVNDSTWIYGPRSFTVKTSSSGTATGSSGSGSATPTAHDRTDAPALPSATRFTGTSIKDSRLSDAVYDLSKYIGAPRMVAVACWSGSDWPTVSGDAGDGFYSTLGFWWPGMPRWINLSPGVCRAMETLLHNRPRYPNVYTSNAVETLTHEAMHSLGIAREAQAECFGMQLSVVLAVRLGVPYAYSDRLAKLNLANYKTRPPDYVDPYNCREDGAWDIWKRHDSPPWHTFRN